MTVVHEFPGSSHVPRSSSASLKSRLTLGHESGAAFAIVFAGIDLVGQFLTQREVRGRVAPQRLVDGCLCCGEAERRSRGKPTRKLRHVTQKLFTRRREPVYETDVRGSRAVDLA